VLASIAEVLAAWDPGRADRLIADAERAAQPITNQAYKANALKEMAKTLAAWDLDQSDRLIAGAERAAQSITDQSGRASALVRIAKIELHGR
jgi:hypothetical protein